MNANLNYPPPTEEEVYEAFGLRKKEVPQLEGVIKTPKQLRVAVALPTKTNRWRLPDEIDLDDFPQMLRVLGFFVFPFTHELHVVGWAMAGLFCIVGPFVPILLLDSSLWMSLWSFTIWTGLLMLSNSLVAFLVMKVFRRLGVGTS